MACSEIQKPSAVTSRKRLVSAGILADCRTTAGRRSAPKHQLVFTRPL